MSYHSNLSLSTTYRTTAADEARRMGTDGAALPVSLAGAPAGAVTIETSPASPPFPCASQDGAAPLATFRQPTPAAPPAAHVTRLVILPAEADIAAALRQLAGSALARGDHRARQRYDDAAGDLAAGRLPTISDDTYLVPSSSRGGHVHRVARRGDGWVCGCEYGRAKATGLCRHIALVEGIAAAWLALAPAPPPPRERPAGDGRTCCAQVMDFDGTTYQCLKCRHWQWSF